MSIIGVLAAVAIPAYNGYKRDAAKSAIISSLNSVAKGFSACLTLNKWASCNSLSGMKVSCPGCTNTSSNSGNTSLCTNVSNEVGGNIFTGCVQTNGGVPTIVGNWPIACNGLSVTYTCTSAGTAPTAPMNTCTDYGCTATAAVPAAAQCVSGSETPAHPCTAAAGDKTNGTQPVNCSSGECG